MPRPDEHRGQWAPYTVTSQLAWIDFSAAERERMARAISLLSESDTVDELGLGTIRDAFSDALFPGTSTIQTRLAYFVFIPWIYRRLEQKRVDPEKLLERGRRSERDLIRALLESEDHEGIIGRRAGAEVKRLPSAAYWGGLHAWEIFLPRWSLDQYVRAMPGIKARRRDLAHARPDDEGVDPEHFSTWHERLPEAPDGFPFEASFKLRRIDAEFLLGRLQVARRCRGTMLSWLASHAEPTDVALPWEHPRLGEMPAAIRAELELGRRFSLAFHGARLLYNLMLWELVSRDEQSEQIDSLRADLAAWAEGESAEAAPLPLEQLFAFLDERGARIPPRTRRFVREWSTRVARVGPRNVVDDADLRALVRDREVGLKTNRSRFLNARARDQWGGASGRARLSYRWSDVQVLLRDLHTGLASLTEPAGTSA